LTRNPHAVVSTALPISWERLLEIMLEEAGKRQAPVLTLKDVLHDPFQHLLFAILSARTRDEITMGAGRRLFAHAGSPESLVNVDIDEIENLIRPVGFYRVKAKLVKKMGEDLIRRFEGRVPLSIDDLLTLPGVGRKTANVVLAASGIPAIAVDTHVHRISNRMKLVKTARPEETEKVLYQLCPEKLWARVNKTFVGFGQTVCKPARPLHDECPFNCWCPGGRDFVSE